ncbi:hypothetical protein SAMN04488128_102580 [Chitinophaga eiseniae]|uniref:CarboxypepD_reg-like domain-containing protein n=1 Tax=Chitinophaga eiseniae TaxID=634771 RepID=A0A1T4QT18_9BACT|nr:carboxypeptidase-like regulatory domain-containing protein [Chitinophaga eiseniae]SKA06870.1 hypothetical protein SAMN04488128_102580 [Chitinophaga eiseniae]
MRSAVLFRILLQTVTAFRYFPFCYFSEKPVFSGLLLLCPAAGNQRQPSKLLKHATNVTQKHNGMDRAIHALSPAAIGGSAGTCYAADQFTSHGRVVNTRTREPLPGAVVNIKGTTHGVSTDAEGSFVFVAGQKFPYTLIIFISDNGAPVEDVADRGGKRAARNAGPVTVRYAKASGSWCLSIRSTGGSCTI